MGGPLELRIGWNPTTVRDSFFQYLGSEDFDRSEILIVLNAGHLWSEQSRNTEVFTLGELGGPGKGMCLAVSIFNMVLTQNPLIAQSRSFKILNTRQNVGGQMECDSLIRTWKYIYRLYRSSWCFDFGRWLACVFQATWKACGANSFRRHGDTAGFLVGCCGEIVGPPPILLALETRETTGGLVFFGGLWGGWWSCSNQWGLGDCQMVRWNMRNGRGVNGQTMEHFIVALGSAAPVD